MPRSINRGEIDEETERQLRRHLDRPPLALRRSVQPHAFHRLPPREALVIVMVLYHAALAPSPPRASTERRRDARRSHDLPSVIRWTSRPRPSEDAPSIEGEIPAPSSGDHPAGRFQSRTYPAWARNVAIAPVGGQARSFAGDPIARISGSPARRRPSRSGIVGIPWMAASFQGERKSPSLDLGWVRRSNRFCDVPGRRR